MASEKAQVRVQRFDALEFMPRFEFGEMAEVSGIAALKMAPNWLPVNDNTNGWSHIQLHVVGSSMDELEGSHR